MSKTTIAQGSMGFIYQLQAALPKVSCHEINNWSPSVDANVAGGHSVAGRGKSCMPSTQIICQQPQMLPAISLFPLLPSCYTKLMWWW
jgi:hypothetical protein